jgi:tRNA A-37 threonylcarbamoyl transferase component Bud32
VPAVLIARFDVSSQIAPLVKAALSGEIVYVALAEPPPGGRNVLQLFIGGELTSALGAELVGSGRDGEYPLRLRLLDEAHATELQRLAAAEPPTARPVFYDEDKTLQSLGAAHADRTLPSGRLGIEEPAPPAAIPGPASPSGPPDELVARGSVTVRESDLEDPTLQRSPGQASSPGAAHRQPYFNDDESQTLPGSIGVVGVVGAPKNVSWNVRIAPTTKDPLCGRTIGGGKYVLGSVIGTGAFGIVFKASHRDLGRTVAIKVLNPRYQHDVDLLAIFRTEARAASQLEHPNVARVYDYGQEPDGLVYIVMEYLSGYTLGSVLAARRKLTSGRAIDVMMQVCAALAAAHEHDIVHRDVKPDNIVLVPEQDDEGQPVENVKVCDFGIAALASTGNEEALAAGTPQYMAPEQTTGQAVRPSADVYGCGVVLYEMLAGEVPFSDDQAYRILMKHRSEAPRPPTLLEPKISAALELVVLKCLEKAPERRYQSARELRVALRKASDMKA